jgi:hypothetical protein
MLEIVSSVLEGSRKRTASGFLGALAAHLEVALAADEDVPARPVVAHVAVPLQQVRVGLENRPLVVAGGVEVVVRDLGVVLGVLALGVLHGES